jgi:hypothetical protein
VFALISGGKPALAETAETAETEELLSALIVNGPWRGEDGRQWRFTTSTIYETPPRSEGLHCVIPFTLNGERLSGEVWYAHRGDYRESAEDAIGRSVTFTLTMRGETLMADGQSWQPEDEAKLAMR